MTFFHVIVILAIMATSPSFAQKDHNVFGNNPPPSDISDASMTCFTTCQQTSTFMKDSTTTNYDDMSNEDVMAKLCSGYNAMAGCIGKCESGAEMMDWMRNGLPENLQDITDGCSDYKTGTVAAVEQKDEVKQKEEVEQKDEVKPNSGRSLTAGIGAIGLAGLVTVAVVLL